MSSAGSRAGIEPRTWTAIDVPTLITVGRYDEITPACAETLRDGIADSRMVLFENSAHLAHLEEGDATTGSRGIPG